MLGILLIYWVGKRYYRMAGYYGKSEWGHVFMALGIYFGSQFILGIVGALVFPDFFMTLESDKSQELLINLAGIVFGLLVWHIIFGVLEKKYESELSYEEDIEDDDISTIGENIEAS